MHFVFTIYCHLLRQKMQKHVTYNRLNLMLKLLMTTIFKDSPQTPDHTFGKGNQICGTSAFPAHLPVSSVTGDPITQCKITEKRSEVFKPYITDCTDFNHESSRL